MLLYNSNLNWFWKFYVTWSICHLQQRSVAYRYWHCRNRSRLTQSVLRYFTFRKSFRFMLPYTIQFRFLKIMYFGLPLMVFLFAMFFFSTAGHPMNRRICLSVVLFCEDILSPRTGVPCLVFYHYEKLILIGFMVKDLSVAFSLMSINYLPFEAIYVGIIDWATWQQNWFEWSREFLV